MMTDIWPPLDDFAFGGFRTPLLHDLLPEWANPQKREENYHHSLRKLFESSDWKIIEGYGPETDIGGELVDVLLDVSPTGDSIAGVDEYTGVEVKSTPNAFESSTQNLEQLIRQAKAGSLDRIYACTPDVAEHETRLDINPENSRLINLLEIASPGMLFRGISGTHRGPDRKEMPLVSHYTRLYHRDKEQLLNELEWNGHLEKVKQNVADSETLSMPGDGDTDLHWDRGDEYIDSILDKVGILRLDPDNGEIRVQKEAKLLDRSRKPPCTRRDKIQESDVVHAVWWQYINQSRTEVCTEVELPSQTEVHKADKVYGTSSDMFMDYFGEQVSRQSPRIDLVVAEGTKLRGVEVKGNSPDWERLVQQQLPTYTAATELDAIDVAVLVGEIKNAREYIEPKFPEVGLISVLNPRNDYEITRVK